MGTNDTSQLGRAVNPNAASILIVEDEAIIALEMEMRLVESGYTVLACVASAAEAFRVVEERRPDVILMDINIEGPEDGITLAGMMKEAYGIPSIFLTAYSNLEAIERASQSTPFGYLTKPFSDSEIRAAIQIGLYKQEKERELASYRESLEKSNKELQDALSALTTLRKLLPICAWCKDVRNDAGYWQEISEYLASQEHISCTHGICPRCQQHHFQVSVPT